VWVCACERERERDRVYMWERECVNWWWWWKHFKMIYWTQTSPGRDFRPRVWSGCELSLWTARLGSTRADTSCSARETLMMSWLIQENPHWWRHESLLVWVTDEPPPEHWVQRRPEHLGSQCRTGSPQPEEHTHTHTHTHTSTLASNAVCQSLSLSLSLSHTHTHSPSLQRFFCLLLMSFYCWCTMDKYT